MVINGIQCDTYVSLDARKAGEPFIFDIATRDSFVIVAYLYQNDEPYPLGEGATVECYFKINDYTGASETIILANCSVGSGGEVLIEIPASLRVNYAYLYGEINVSEQSSGVDVYRMRATNFQLYILNCEPKNLIDADSNNFLDSGGNQVLVY